MGEICDTEEFRTEKLVELFELLDQDNSGAIVSLFKIGFLISLFGFDKHGVGYSRNAITR